MDSPPTFLYHCPECTEFRSVDREAILTHRTYRHALVPIVKCKFCLKSFMDTPLDDMVQHVRQHLNQSPNWIIEPVADSTSSPVNSALPGGPEYSVSHPDSMGLRHMIRPGAITAIAPQNALTENSTFTTHPVESDQIEMDLRNNNASTSSLSPIPYSDQNGFLTCPSLEKSKDVLRKHVTNREPLIKQESE